jgi:hypothetical protein
LSQRKQFMSSMQTVHEFHKNSVEKVKICRSEYRGNNYFDIRIWVLQNPAEPGSEIATKKGITLSVDLLPDLMAGLEKAKEILEENNAEENERKEKQKAGD